MKTQPVSNIQFKALPLSNVKIITNGSEAARYTLYKAAHSDEPFLEEIAQRTNIMKRYTKLTGNEYQSWYDVMIRGLYQSLDSNTHTILLANSNNNPCGFLNYTEKPLKFEVNYVSTWPVIPNQRGIMAGKTLFYELFNIFKKGPERNSITLEALTDGAFSPVSKYLELGFKLLGGPNGKENMKISDAGVSISLDKFKSKILRTEIENSKDINLYDELKIVSD